MAVGLYFQPKEFTPERYDEAIRELDKAGLGFGSVPGRTFHCALEAGGQIQVFDVWNSMDDFEKFGETLLPIMSKLGVDPGQPQVSTVYQVHNG